MGLPSTVVVAVLALISASNAFHKISVGKEVVYEYQAVVRAGSLFPVSSASVLYLHGKLHLQANDNSTHVQLADLKTVVYNGELDHEQELNVKDIPLPPEAQELELPFRIVYNEEGQALGIGTNGQEKEWTRNFKKALAGVLQLDHQATQTVNHPIAFSTEEESIYGFGQVDYYVVPLFHDNEVEIHKSHHMKTSKHLYQYYGSNLAEMNDLTESEQQPLNHDSNRKYLIATVDGQKIVKRIEASGSLYYTPFNSKSDAQYLRTNQTIELVGVVPITKQLQVQNEHYDWELAYNYYEDEEKTETLFDYTNGRVDVDENKVIEEVVKMAAESWQYLQQDHIHTGVPNAAHGQLINRLVGRLLLLNVQQLQQVHDRIAQSSTADNKEILEIYHKILPIVGTKATVLFIKKLVIDKVVSNEVAVELLQNFPNNVIIPSQDLVKQVEILMNLGQNVDWSVRKAGILSFASLIQESIEYYSSEGHENHKKPVRHHDYIPDYNDDTEEEIKSYVKYVEEYQRKLTEPNVKNRIKLVYLMGLHNMQHPHVYDVLKPLLIGDQAVDQELKFMTIIAIAPLIIENPEAVQKILWPILVNPLEYTEVRMAAYYIIMESEPGASVLNSIYWHMVHETDVELYSFHYTFFVSLAKSVDPEKTEMKNLALRLLRYMQPSVHGLSNVDFHAFKNWEYGFGAGWHGALMASNVSHILTLRQVSNYLGVYAEDQSAVIRITGLSAIFDDRTFTKYLESKLGITRLQGQNDLKIEIVLFKHGQAYSVQVIEKDNLKELGQFLKIFSKEIPILSIQDKFVSIDYLRAQRALIPTDLGTPAMWEFLMPMVQYGDVALSRDITQRAKFIGKVDGYYKTWTHYQHGLVFYNPLIDIWQGVSRIQAHDTVLPLNVEVEIWFLRPRLKWSWQKNSDADKNILGVRSHVMTYVFAQDYHQKDWLKQSSPHSQPWVVVSNGEKYRYDYTLLDDDVLAIGHNVKAVAFDSGYHVSNGTVQQLLYQISKSQTKNESPLWNAWLSLEHLYAYGLILPRPGVHGLMVRLEPITSPQVTSIDWVVRAYSVFENPKRYDSAGKAYAEMIYAVKSNDEELISSKLSGNFSTNDGRTVDTTNIQITYSAPGDKNDFKICIDGSEKVIDEKIEGDYTVILNKSAGDDECNEADGIKFEIEKLGQVSNEQKEKYHLYGSCLQPTPYWVQAIHSPQCLLDVTSVRHYTYKLKSSSDIPSEIKSILSEVWDFFKGEYSWHYTEDDENLVDLGDNKLRLDVFFPMTGKEVDIHVSTPSHIYNLTALPLDELKWWGWFPESLVYTKYKYKFALTHKLPYVDVCQINMDHLQIRHGYLALDQEVPVPNDWTVYYSQQTEDIATHTVEVKKVQDLIGVKIKVESFIWELVPQGEGKLPQISVNGKVTEDHVIRSDWMYQHLFDNENHNTLVVWLPQIGLQMDYFGDRVILSVVRSGQITGKCVSA